MKTNLQPLHFIHDTKTPLVVPSPELIAQTGYDPVALSSATILPQPAGTDAYRLVVADLARLDVERYQQAGIEISIDAKEAIDSIWSAYFLKQRQRRNKKIQGPLNQCGKLLLRVVGLIKPLLVLPIQKLLFSSRPRSVPKLRRGFERGSASSNEKPDIIDVVRQLAQSASDLRAQECFINVPSYSMYEFTADGQCYQGKLGQQVTKHLLSQIGTSGFEIPASATFPQNIRIAPISGTHYNALFLSWVPAAPTVLLVDDDLRFLELLSNVLKQKGLQVVTSNHAHQALTLISDPNNQIKLIICDLHMPHVDGRTLLKQLRSRGNRIPVLMLTSEQETTAEIDCVRLGVEAYVKKQEDPRILLAWCQSLLLNSAGNPGS